MKNPFAKKPKSNYAAYDDNAYDNGYYAGGEDGIVGDIEEEKPAAPAAAPRKAAPASSPSQFKVVKPRSYQDGPDIADHLIDGFTVVLDIEGLDPKSSIRLIDFLAGALQVLGGELRRVTKTTFVLSPHAGGFSDEEDGIDG